MTFSSEAEMQGLIEQLLSDGAFGNAISGRDSIELLAEPAPDVLPIFAIDRVARAAMLAAARDVLADIDDLTVLTSDANISMSRGETLRPDFICISASTQSVYLIELKKSAQTAREAITELLGYEHEIKNYLPFLANHDLNFVLISSEWSTLLDHSASSACAWSRKKLLCLEAGLDDGDPDPRLFVAMNLLARSGDRTGAHGFAMLWRDRFDAAGRTFHITVGGVDPIAFFDAAVDNGMIDRGKGHFTIPFEEAVTGAPRTVPASLFALVRGVRPVIEEFVGVTMEGFLDWETARETYLCRAEPVSFEFWGLLGDHARAYLTNPAVRGNRMSLLDGGRIDWTHPFLGLFLLQSFRGNQFLPDGEIHLSDAFALGSALGTDGGLREIINNPNAVSALSVLEPAFLWNSYTTAHMLEELMLVTSSTSSIAPLGEFHFSLRAVLLPEAQMGNLIHWISTQVLRDQSHFVSAFNLGMRGGVAFSSALARVTGDSFASAREALAPELSDIKAAALSLLAEAKANGPLSREQMRLAEVVARTAAWDDRSAMNMFRLLDTLIPAVAHQLNAVAPSNHDWDWLKQGVREVRAAGGRPAIVLSADGILGTMDLIEPALLIMGDVTDTENEVLFLNNLSGLHMLVKTTWDALARGDHFPVMGGKATP